MSGRPKQKVYHYDSNGKFLKIFESESDVRKEFYPEDRGIRPLFNRKCKDKPDYSTDILEMKDKTIICKNRIGRAGIRKWKQDNEDKYLTLSQESDPVFACNSEGKMIASFINMRLASELTGIPQTTIWSQINKGKGLSKKKTRLIFKRGTF